MPSKKIRWWMPQMTGGEYKLIKTVLDDNFPNEGPLATEFEDKVKALVGSEHAVAVTNGTSAIFLALKACGVKPGDEVIVPDVTFIATANAAQMCGGRPVLVDVDEKTMNMSPEAFGKAITKKTKAVVPVHVSGRAADMKAIMEIAEENGVDVVEDAAEGFMSRHRGKYLGTFGRFGCLSFSPNKIITTGQGGIILAHDEDHVLLRKLKDHGRPVRGTGGDDIHPSIGYNFKFTDLQAAVGLGQLPALKRRMTRMVKIRKIYQRRLEGVPGISVFKADLAGGELPLWTDALVEDRDGLDRYLSGNGIGCRRFWHPIHTQAPYRTSGKGLTTSLRLSGKALWLPSAFTLTDEDVNFVCERILEYLIK